VAKSVPTFEPTEITIGATVKWRKTHPDYKSSDGWTLAYYFRGPASGAGKGLNLEGEDFIVADGDGWLVTIPATSTEDDPSTANLSPGAYYWQAWVSKDGEEYQVGASKTTVKPNLFDLDTAAAYDGRSEVKQTLDAIRAAIAGRATAAQQSRTIGNTSIEFMGISDLIAAETKFQQLYNQEVRRARAARGESAFRMVRTRFVPPT
jgi:hypothetical protein